MLSRSLLYIALGLLMVVSIIELSLVSSTVGFLHGSASGTFSFFWRRSTYDLGGHPKNFLLDQGHTSNGAAGTAFVLIGCGGIPALWLRSRPKPHRINILVYRLWLIGNVLALLLTLGALIYVFVVVKSHSGQQIFPSVAAELDGAPYDLNTWTPQNWFSAVLKLDLASPHERSIISRNLALMRGWQYNLIPLFIIQFIETGLALFDA
jgi:hypothetical protein